MENKNTKIVSMIAIIALVLTVVTATYAYFQAQTGEGSQADIKINANTVDTLSFETSSSLAFTADQDTFANGKASLSDTTFAKAILTANNKTNSATNNYNLYLNISDNNFTYTQDTNTPELLLQITDATNSTDNATEYEAKIVLMYVSDYGYAASPSAWTTTLNNYDGSDTNETEIVTINWMYMGASEWSISRSADISDCAFIVNKLGHVNGGSVSNDFVVRPSFNLESSVAYKSGTGTMSDPILIN